MLKNTKKGTERMKVLYLDKNVEYAKRWKQFMENKHPLIQVFICDDAAAAIATVSKEKCDVMFADAVFDSMDPKDIEKIESTAAFAFVSERDELIFDREAFCKYITIEEWYEKICTLYEKKKNRIIRSKARKEVASNLAKVITFLPVSGGAGSSTMAAACAAALSASDPVLYVNLEQKASDAAFFTVQGKKDLSDVASMLNSKFTDSGVFNLLRETIGRDEAFAREKLHVLRGYKNIIDSVDMTPEAISALIRILKKEEFGYKFIVLDADCIAGKTMEMLITLSDSIVFVSNGTETANEKLQKVRQYMEIISQNEGIMPKEYIAFNQYYGMKDEAMVVKDMEILLRLPRYRTNEGGAITPQTIIRQVLSMPAMVFDMLR